MGLELDIDAFKLASYFFAALSIFLFSLFVSFRFHILPFLQEDRYHFAEEMFIQYNDDAMPR